MLRHSVHAERSPSCVFSRFPSQRLTSCLFCTGQHWACPQSLRSGECGRWRWKEGGRRPESRALLPVAFRSHFATRGPTCLQAGGSSLWRVALQQRRRLPPCFVSGEDRLEARQMLGRRVPESAGARVSGLQRRLKHSHNSSLPALLPLPCVFQDMEV